MKKTDKIGVEIYLKQYEDMFKQYQELLNKGMGNHKDMLTSIMREQLDDLKDTYKLPMDKIREIEDRILAPKLKEQAEKAAQQAKKDAEDYLKKNQAAINKALDTNKDSMKTLLETNNLVVESSKKALEDAKKAKEAIEKQDKKMKMDRVRGERALKAQKARAEKENRMREEQAKSMYFEAAPSADYEVIDVPGVGHKYKHTKVKTAKLKSGKEIDFSNIRQLSVTKLASLITHNFEDFEALAKENAQKIADFEAQYGKTPLDKDLRKKHSELLDLQEEYRNADLNLKKAQKRGTAFHKVVELVEKGQVSLNDLTEDKIKELGKQYDEIGEGLSFKYGETKIRPTSSRDLLKLVKQYNEFKKQTGLGGQTTTETPLGMLVDLGDEVVEVAGTFDSIFNEMSTLIDFKTSGRVDVKKIGIQLNLLKKMALLNPKFMKSKGIKGLDALKVFHLPFKYGEQGGVYDVDTADDAMMWQWIKSAFDILGGETTEKPDVPVLMRGKLTLGEWQNKKKGTSGRQWLLNNISLNDLAKQYERGTMSYEEIMDNINSLNEEDRRHFINLIWSTKEYEEKKKTQRVFKVVNGKRVPLLDEQGNIQYDESGKPLYEMQDIVSSMPPRETGKLYRQGALWDRLRGDLDSFQKEIEKVATDEYANIADKMTKIQERISKIKISYAEAKEYVPDEQGNLQEVTKLVPANEKEKAKENRRDKLMAQREALRAQLAEKASSAFSEQVFKTEQGYGSAQTVGGGFLSEWAKAYRIHAEQDDGLAEKIANRFVSYILNAGLSDFQLDELKGGLAGIATKDEANQAFVDAIQDRLLGKHSIIAPDLDRVQKLEDQIKALNQERASLDKGVPNPRIEEIDELVQRLIAEQDRLKYAQEVGGIFSDEPIGINEMTDDYALEKGKKSAAMRGGAATNRAAQMIGRLRAFSEYDLSDKSFDDVMGFIKGLSGIRNEFKGFLNALGSDENSEIDEYGVPEYIEKSENILDAWTTFVRNLKNKIRGLENLDENQIEAAVQGLDISTGVQEDIGGLAKKTGHKLSWLYQLKDIYDEFLSPEMEEVNKSLSEKAKFTSVEQYAKSRLTQAQYEQYASSIDFRKSISEGKDFSTVISQFLDTPEFQLKSNLATALQKALAKIMEANPQLLDDTIYNIFMTQTDLGEGNKMKWWHGIGASERLRRGDVVRNWAYNPNEILTTKPEMIAEVEERAEEKLRNESSIRDAVESARIRAEQSAKEYNQKAFDIKKQITAQTGFDIEDYDKKYGFDKYENAYKKLYALAMKVGRGETDYKDFMRGELGRTRLSGETLQKYEELRKGLEIAQLQMGVPDDMSEEAKELFAKRQHLFEEYYIPSLRDKSYVSILRKRYGVKGDESYVLAQQAAVVNQIKSLPDQALLNTASEINDAKNIDVDANSITVGEPEKVENNTEMTEIKADTVVVNEAESSADAEKPAKRRGRPRKKKTEDIEGTTRLSDEMGVSSDGGAGGDGGGKKPPKSGGRKGKSDEEKAQADAEKRQKQDIREYQQYVNKVISLESQIDKLQRQATLSGGKHKDAIYGTIDALNEELGDLNRNNDALVKRVAAEQSATKASIDATAELKKQSNAQKNLVSVKGATSIWDMMANDIRRATMRIADFGIAAKILNKIPQDIQKVIQYTKELDAAMTNVRVVTGASAEEAQMLARGYTQLAKELGVTTVEIANSANEWARQGYEAEEANQLIVASSKLAKLGMISTTEATKDLTSAIKGFKLSTEEAMSVVDKLTKIDQVAAISAGNLAEGLARVATTAQQAGLSLDETAAMVTTITEVTQRDASTAGEALRTLISRYSNVKAGVFTSMGEEAEETSGNINDIEKVLGKLGIRIRTSGTEMRSIEDVLDELAEKWDTLDDVSRNAVASAFAGVRQRESFNILLSNWDRVKELTEESANAAGTADEKYTAYMDSMEAATKRLQNAWEGFTQSLETSTVMKLITNTAAFLVENADKLKYLVTAIAAASSAKIFDFFTNKGEIGGFKGLIANIPFIGRGTKTNNILESIDKKVGNIEKGVGADALANQTKNGGFFKRLGGFLKTGFGRGDIYDPETGKSISYNLLKKYQILRDEKGWMPVSQMETYSKLLKQRQIGNAAMGAVSAVLTNLLTTKEVGASGLGKLVNTTDQTIEETAGDKIRRTLASGGLAALGGAFFGPFGAMIGQVVGEGAASIVSTIVHRSELEMKQRVQIAKENVNKLDNLVSTIDSGDRLLSEEINTAEGYQDLYDYTDKLYEQLFELQYERDIDITEAFNNALANNDESVHITKISDLVDSINTGNVEQRKMIKRQLEIAESQVKIAEIRKAQEAERKKANDAIKSDEVYKETMFETASPQLKGFNFEGLEWKGWAKNKLQFSQTGLSTDTKNEILKKNIALLREAITQTSDTGKIEAYNTFIKSFEKFTNKVDSAYATIEKLNKEIFKSEVNFGFLSADIHDLSDEELQDLTMDGIMGRVVQTMEEQGYEVRDTAGYIKKDYADAIKTQITNDSELSALQNVSTKTLSELTAAQERFTDATGATIDEWNKWYDLAVKGALSEEIAKIVYAANPEKIEQFARAWNMTTEEIKGLVEEFPNLTTAIGLMNPSQVREYYGGFTGIFDDWSNDLVLSASNLEKLISDYPQLLKYYKSGTLSSELIKSMGNEQAVAYSNALFNEIISSKDVGSEFKKALKEQDKTFIGIASSNEIESVYKQYLIGLKDINSMIEKSIELKQSDNEEERKAGELITSLINKYMDYEQEIEWANPFYDKAKQAEIELFERQINNLEEQKNALSDVNSEREKELELIKAKEALENAKKEKRRVYRAGIGFVMEADEDAITQAQKQISELDISKKQDDIQLQIDQYELLKNILSSQDDEKTKQNNKEALDEWLKSSGYNGVSDVVSALIEGYAKNKLVINVGSGVIKDADGNIIGKTGNIGDDESGYIGSKNENITKSSEKLSTAIGDFVEAENKIKSMKIGQAGYAEAAQDYGHKKDVLNEAVISADSAGVKSVDMNYARKLLSGYQEPTHTDWKLIEGLSNPSTKGHAAEGTHDIMLTTDHPLTSKEKEKQFKKDKYSYIKLYDASNESLGSWESLTKVKGRNISNLPDYTIIMNDDYKDAYAFVKDGKLYWLSDTKGNVKKEYTWQDTWASGTLSTPIDSTALINELGTEAVITPGGTLTALPSKTGIVPADITRNVWALGEVAPTLVAQLSSLNQKALTGNAGNTTYEEGQYIDNLTMNVYPTKDYDMDKLLSEARAKAKLTRHNN